MNEPFSFIHKSTEFGTDNCATNHICHQKELFVSISQVNNNIGVRGVSGDTKAAGLGSVRFTTKDDEGNQHNILLDNVFYLPTATKNLLSIAQWSATRRDNYSVTSHGTQSIFRWNNDKNAKTIHHPSGCPIPLMAVNENDDHFSLFIDKHFDKFIDKDEDYTETIASSAVSSVNKQFIDNSRERGGSQFNFVEG